MTRPPNRTARAVLAAALAALPPALAGCARPTGDFGRAAPSLVHDTVLPAGGDLAAHWLRGEPVSDFPRTDAEETLRDRAWALVLPPHARDWIGDILVEGQRTRILPEIDRRYNIAAYYSLLVTDRFRSSEARWNRIAEDMDKDALLVGPFWAEVRRVAAADRARLAAMDRRRDLGVGELEDAFARIDENARTVDWVWRAMRFRLASYRWAIDRLAVATPSARLAGVEAGWRRLEAAIAEAERGSTGPVALPATATRPARVLAARPDEPVPQK